MTYPYTPTPHTHECQESCTLLPRSILVCQTEYIHVPQEVYQCATGIISVYHRECIRLPQRVYPCITGSVSVCHREYIRVSHKAYYYKKRSLPCGARLGKTDESDFDVTDFPPDLPDFYIYHEISIPVAKDKTCRQIC